MACGMRYKDDFVGTAALTGKKGAGGDFSNVMDHVERSGGTIRWLRLAEVCRNMGYVQGEAQPLLFDSKIEPADILQGGLGDCWLLAGIASVSLYPHLIRQIFVQREYNPYGKYKLRLFDRKTLKPVTVTVDDRIPCDKDGRPLFARPNGKEGWVLILEKAFAKLWGSYQDLDGGLTEWAVVTMLGCPIITYRAKGGSFVRIQVERPVPDESKGIGKTFSSKEMFKVLSISLKLGSLASASISDPEAALEARDATGLVNRHAYSVLRTAKAKGSDGATRRIVCLRNPWGTGEWKGDWGDSSPLWDQHPKVRAAANFSPSEDGEFWMPWEDFASHYDYLRVMPRDLGAPNLLMEYDESRPWCGPCAGCGKGLIGYCFCCVGCRAVCCAVDADYVAETDAKHASCFSARWWYNRVIGVH